MGILLQHNLFHPNLTRMLNTLKTRSICNNLLLTFTVSFIFSCQKDISLEDGGTIAAPPDLITKVSSSVSGFVTDENDAAIKGATVQFGASNITTDKYGYFEAKNVQVVKEAAVVTVTMPGYFKGIKTYMAKEGKAAFFRIKLIPKTNVGNVNAASGGTVTLANGLSIKLPAGAVVNAATNAAYTGIVNIAAYWINPEAADLNKIMPGDLRGIDKNNSMKLLQTFGMAAVELTGSSGELLQIAAGKKATLTLVIPASLSASAPAAIPLWYFDEAKGLWKEEGSATKTGNTYVGDVSHFSFWNVDLPGPYIRIDGTVKDNSGNPVPWSDVRVYLTGNSALGVCRGYTDANGYVYGFVPANSQLTLEILAGNCSSTPVHSQNFSTSNANISFGNLTITNTQSIFTISGTVTDCNNTPVTNGVVYLQAGNLLFPFGLSSTGSFNFSWIFCTSPIAVSLFAEDLNALQGGNPVSFNLTSGNNVVGNIVACGINTQKFLNVTINGNNHNYVAPPDWIVEDWNSGLPSTADIKVWAYSSINNSNTQTYFKQQNIAVNSNQDLISFTHSSVPDSLMPASPILVHITEYGNIGQYISGNFSGTLKGFTNPANTYNVSCNFRVKREY